MTYYHQVQQGSCRSLYFWDEVRSYVKTFRLRDWETLYGVIAFGIRPREPEICDSS